MKRASWFLSLAACALAVGIACSKKSSAPIAPTALDPALIEANADGSLLKVTAPTLQSPVNGVRLAQGTNVVLVLANSTTTFASPVALSYRFELMNSAGAMVDTAMLAGGNGTTSRPINSELLEGEKTYSWRARAEYQGIAGPWSAVQSFVAPPNDGYIRGNELYDPLINGKTVGEIHGPVRFIPGVGVQLLGWESYISYELPQTLTDGEYSLIVTNMPANTEGQKQKVMAMSQGYSDLIVNDRRMTVEKRGDPPGVIAFRFLTHDDEAETVGNWPAGERRPYNFQADRVYFFEASWRNMFFNVRIVEDGVAGTEVYNFGKPFHGRPYDPTPHVIFVGAPIGRSGPESASIENTIYRQIWVSANPRPPYANK